MRQRVPSRITSSIFSVLYFFISMHNDQLQFLWWGGRLKQRRCCSGLLELSWIADSTKQVATGCCGFPERVVTSPPFYKNCCSKNGKGMDCYKSRLVKGTSSLNLLPHTWIIPLPATKQKKKQQSTVLNLKETPQTRLIIFNMACRHVKLKLLEPTHLSKGF